MVSFVFPSILLGIILGQKDLKIKLHFLNEFITINIVSQESDSFTRQILYLQKFGIFFVNLFSQFCLQPSFEVVLIKILFTNEKGRQTMNAIFGMNYLCFCFDFVQSCK